MSDSPTGMRPGERYQVENLERAHQFPGFFLDGKYYLGPELLTAVGWLEGQRFIYDNLDATGEPIFPDRLAGSIEDLTLTLVDGTALMLVKMSIKVAIEPDETDEPATDTWRTPRPQVPQMLAIGAMLLLGGCALALLNRRRR